MPTLKECDYCLVDKRTDRIIDSTIYPSSEVIDNLQEEPLDQSYKYVRCLDLPKDVRQLLIDSIKEN